jgi:hypothetical protein
MRDGRTSVHATSARMVSFEDGSVGPRHGSVQRAGDWVSDAARHGSPKSLVPSAAHAPSGGFLHGPSFKIPVKPRLLLFDLRQHCAPLKHLPLDGADGTVMSRLLLAVLFVVGLVGTATADSGNDLLDRCSSSAEVNESYCAGYVVGVVERLLARHGPFCPPPKVAMQQLKDVMVLYLQDHPEVRDVNAAALTALALAAAFPCPEPRGQGAAPARNRRPDL